MQTVKNCVMTKMYDADSEEVIEQIIEKINQVAVELFSHNENRMSEFIFQDLLQMLKGLAIGKLSLYLI